MNRNESETIRGSSEVDLRGLAVDRAKKDPSEATHRRQLLSRYVLPLLLLIGFVSLATWASWEWISPPRSVTVMPVYTTTAEIDHEGAPLFQAAGWIEPRPTPVRVAALSPGVVESLLVIEDQPVTVGQPIARLISDDAQLAYERALADLELRQAELDQTKAALIAAETRLKNPVHLEAILGEAEALLAEVQTRLQNLPFETRRAVANYEAMRKGYQGKLSAKGAIAGVEIDVAKANADAAKALVDELHGRSESLQREHTALTRRRDALSTQLELRTDEIRARDEADAEVKVAVARVTQARVAVAEAKLRLDRMTVVSPIDGRVFRLFAHPGARIGSGMTQMAEHDGSTVVTLYRPDMLQVRVDVRFEDIPRVGLNQPVRIDNPALTEPLTGQVLFVSSEADIQKNTLQVKVGIPDPPSVFKPEMLVDVTFLSPPRPSGDATSSLVVRDSAVKIFVPRNLVRNQSGETFVWVADQSGGLAIRQPIETGAESTDGLVEVRRGLNVASRLIVAGGEGLADADRIRVSGEDTEMGTSTRLPDS
jgi:multidrug efflux pump subunit AcrA (membrane-fusion protein)